MNNTSNLQNTPSPPQGPIKRIGVRTLNSAHDVRRLMGKLIKLRLANEIDSELLRVITYSVQTLLKAIESSETESRLIKLEEQIKELEKEGK